MMSVSVNTLALALKSINRDIRRLEEKLRTENLDSEENDYYGEYVLDLSRALSELSGVYESERKRHSNLNLPTADELLQAP